MVYPGEPTYFMNELNTNELFTVGCLAGDSLGAFMHLDDPKQAYSGDLDRFMEANFSDLLNDSDTIYLRPGETYVHNRAFGIDGKIGELVLCYVQPELN